MSQITRRKLIKDLMLDVVIDHESSHKEHVVVFSMSIINKQQQQVNLPRTGRTRVVMRSVTRSSCRSWRVWAWPLRPLGRRTWRIGPGRMTTLRILVNTTGALGSVVLEYVVPTSTTTSSGIGGSGSCVRTSNEDILIQSPSLGSFVVALIRGHKSLPLVPELFILVSAPGQIVDNSTVTNGRCDSRCWTSAIVLVIILMTAAKDGILRFCGFTVAGTGICKSTCHQRTSRQKKQCRGISDDHHGGDGSSITNQRSGAIPFGV